jgi:peroxiredoxin
MIKSYDLWNEEIGTSNRAVVVVDKDGIVRFKQEYQPLSPPNPLDVLAEVEKLS